MRVKKYRLTLGKSTRKGQDLEPLGLNSRAASPEWAFGELPRSQMQRALVLLMTHFLARDG